MQFKTLKLQNNMLKNNTYFALALQSNFYQNEIGQNVCFSSPAISIQRT